ncbi:c-type cytochrome biogenesis protein CcmI [Imhoffiella purpurea]|uniref:Cytochrome c heme lyase subunit CcmH n=1 Tax=Imhoffiella purpurea TaxID=1249627 RepID=W9VHV4_9GAMM|nr:c-type cytochrome biogenesis protein CcmI [Imhoffiella purpurea]EXJ16586.1 Cytochrome c heme lyase subunit CcmH [Imhoffiella purpurea]
MIIFWILAGGLLALALWIILPPLLRRETAADTPDQNALNLAVFEQRLKELEDDRTADLIEEERYLAARHDLERELLYDVDDAEKPARRPASAASRWLLAALLATAVPASAVLMYLELGNPALIDRIEGSAGQAAAEDGSDTQSGASLEELVGRLQERLKEDPDNVDGWLMLGRTYFATDRIEEGLAAFEKAYQLAPDQVPVMLAYAEALASASPGKSLAGRPAELIRAALEKDPQDPMARWLAGMITFQEGGYQEAADAWQTILDELEPGSDDAKNLGQMIDEARSRVARASETGSGAAETQPAASRDATATAQSGEAAAAESASVTVRVSLAPSIAEQASPEDSVFVFARATQGPPMPLAAKRIQVKDLPAEVVLDDSQAMSPTLKLSGTEQITIGARVSKSGDATPRAGDLEGTAAPIGLDEDAAVSVVIDRVRP